MVLAECRERACSSYAEATPIDAERNGSPKGNPEGLGEMMKRVLHAVQLAVPIGIITRSNIAQSVQQSA